MESLIDDETRKELSEILSAILLGSQIDKSKQSPLSYEEAIDKLNSFNAEKESTEIKLFSFFMKNLFLNEEGNFDLNVKDLNQKLSKESVKTIFNSLVESIQSKRFLDFLLDLGEVIRKMYFRKQLDEINKKYEHKGLNSYEIIFKIFTMCKTKERKYIFANYDAFYAEAYLNKITYDLIFAYNICIKLLMSNENIDDLFDLLEEEEKTSDNSMDKAKKMEKIKNLIIQKISTFWCNSYYLNSVELDDFMNLFYNFFVNNIDSILDKNVEDSIKDYYDFISYPLNKLFEDFNSESFAEFKLSLFDFVEKNKNKNIKFIERANLIGVRYKLSKDNIGLVSMICANKNFTDEIEVIKSEKKEKNESLTKEDINKIIDDKKYCALEICALGIILDEQKIQTLHLESTTNLSANSNYKDSINDKIIPENDINQQIKASEAKKEETIESIEDIIKDNNLTNKVDNTILSLIEKNNKNILVLNQKLSFLMKEYSSLKEEILNLKEEISNLKEENRKEIAKLNDDIGHLRDIHKKIYFRNVSKYYIKEFAYYNKISGENTFTLCQNILLFDFEKSIKFSNLKDIITKIVFHYLNGNKIAHMEYFISIAKSLNKIELAEEIENAYMDFMKFKNKERQLLSNSLKLKNSSFIYYHQFK